MTIETAENLYKIGDFHKAQAAYEVLVRDYPQQPELWFNLGNTYYRLGFKGKAVGAYLKAKIQMPRDAELNSNLTLVRSQVIGHTPQKDWDLFTFQEWTLGLWILLTLLNVIVFLRRKKKVGLELGQNLFYAGLVLTVLFLGGYGFKAYRTFGVHKAVAVTQDTEVRAGPSEAMGSLFVLHEGTEMRLIGRSKNWAKIQLENGYTGWVLVQDLWIL